MLTRIGDVAQSDRILEAIQTTNARIRSGQLEIATGKRATTYEGIAGDAGLLLDAPDPAPVDGGERLPAWRLVVARHAGGYPDELDPAPGRADPPAEAPAAPAVLRPEDPWRHRA